MDEIHSLQLTQLPVSRVLDEAARDFHPPGYALALTVALLSHLLAAPAVALLTVAMGTRRLAAAVAMGIELERGGLDAERTVGPGPFHLELPVRLETARRPVLRVRHPVWSPARSTGSTDRRWLTFLFEEAWLEPAEPTRRWEPAQEPGALIRHSGFMGPRVLERRGAWDDPAMPQRAFEATEAMATASGGGPRRDTMDRQRADPPPSARPALQPGTASRRIAALLLLVLVTAACRQEAGAGADATGAGGSLKPVRHVTVFAAASLRDALQEVAPEWRREGLEPSFNFAGSNVLARQIEATTAADVFVSANPDWVDHLEAAGRLVPGSREAVLANRLVVVARQDSPVEMAAPADLATAEYRYLSVGDPGAVPAGIYARRFLQRVAMPAPGAAPTTGGSASGTESGGSTLWQRVQLRLAPAPDVRAALAQVEARRDVVGIVYATDARGSGRVRVLFEVPPELAPEIVYEAAAIRGGPAGEAAARRALEVLSGEAARQVFRRHGFRLPATEGGGAHASGRPARPAAGSPGGADRGGPGAATATPDEASPAGPSGSDPLSGGPG